MSFKFFYLYLVGGIVSLLLLVYQVVANYPNVSPAGVAFNAIPVLLLLYMAYKVNRERTDKDLM